MRLLWPSPTKLLKSMKHSRKEELPKEDAKMDFLTRQRREPEAFVSLFHPLWDYQYFALLVCVCCVGRFLLFLSGDWFSPFLAFDAQGPKTVTLVMMSAAQEPCRGTCQPRYPPRISRWTGSCLELLPFPRSPV